MFAHDGRAAMKPQTGLLLRLVGPLIEVVCLILLFASRGKGWTLAGIDAQMFFYGGFAIGFVLVMLGLTLGRPTPRRKEE